MEEQQPTTRQELIKYLKDAGLDGVNLRSGTTQVWKRYYDSYIAAVEKGFQQKPFTLADVTQYLDRFNRLDVDFAAQTQVPRVFDQDIQIPKICPHQ